jgi:type IV pilus assembly protein PilA
MKTPQYYTGGFTLVEIMVVVVIIGLLAALAIPAFNKSRELSREKAITNNLRQIAAAAQQYILEQGVTAAAYPDLVGTATDKYLHNITPVAQEDYTAIVVNNTDTQISVTGPIITVTYNL